MVGETKKLASVLPHLYLFISRNVVQFIADCFYKEETWSDCESERFADEAKKCVEESLRNIYDHSDGKR